MDYYNCVGAHISNSDDESVAVVPGKEVITVTGIVFNGDVALARVGTDEDETLGVGGAGHGGDGTGNGICKD